MLTGELRQDKHKRSIWQERAVNPVEIVALDALDLRVILDNDSDTLSSPPFAASWKYIRLGYARLGHASDGL